MVGGGWRRQIPGQVHHKAEKRREDRDTEVMRGDLLVIRNDAVSRHRVHDRPGLGLP